MYNNQYVCIRLESLSVGAASPSARRPLKHSQSVSNTFLNDSLSPFLCPTFS